MKKRLKWALILCAISFGLAGVLGAVFGAISMDEDDTFLGNWLLATEIMYSWFCASFTVGGILMVITPLQEDHAIGFGAGLYYGTVFLASAIREYFGYVGDDALLFFIAIVIVALICYIVWLKYFKQKYEKV